MGTIKIIYPSKKASKCLIIFDHITKEITDKYTDYLKIICRDPINFYFLGFENKTESLYGNIDLFNKIINDNQIIEITTIGFCKGGYSSLLYGSLLKANKIIAIAPIVFLDHKNALKYNDSRLLDFKMDILRNYGLQKFPYLHYYLDINNILNETSIYNIYVSNLDIDILHVSHLTIKINILLINVNTNEHFKILNEIKHLIDL
jgi:hypothetical protein